MNFILDDISFLLNKETCIKYFKELILRYPCYEVGSPTPSFMEEYVRYLGKKKEVVIPEKEIECLAKKDFREIQSRIICLARGKEIFES